MQSVKRDDGVSISYDVVGDGPQDVVLIHGWMVSGRVYDALVEELSGAGFRFVIPHLRGTKSSGQPETGHSLNEHANDVLAVMEAVGVKNAVVFGHSMAGQLAPMVAARKPSAVKGVMVVCPVPPSGLKLPDEAHGLFRNCAGNRDAQGAILDMACKELTPETRARLLDDSVGTSTASIQQSYDAWTGGGVEAEFAKVEAPVLVVGTDDPFFPPAFLKDAVVSKLSRARFALLPGPGHYPQVERPRETAALLSAFVAGLS